MLSAEFLYGASVKAAMILSGASVAALLLRKRPASARYLVWNVALAATLAVPALGLLLAKKQVMIVAAAVPIPADFVDFSATAGSAAAPAADWVAWVWAAGFCAVMARLAAGHLSLHRLLRRARPVTDADWLRLAGEVADGRRPRLRRSAEIDVPLSYGVLNPVVLIDAATESASEEMRRVVLLHEMTHIRRRDGLLSLGAQAVVALYWFNPLAWYAYSCFRKEQERSCDDAVVNGGVARVDYARHLVDVARQITGSRPRFSQGLCMAHPRDFEQRVLALLEARSRGALSRRALAVAVTVSAICVIPLAALRGQATGQTGSVAGAVSDASGARVPKAGIVLKSQDGKRQEIARADEAGEFTLPHVAAGTYDVEVRSPGFAMWQNKGLKVDPGQAVRMDVQLALGQISETLDIVGKGTRPVPPAPAGTPKRIRVGGNVQATKLLKIVRPVYPIQSQSAGIEGTVLLRAVISTSGDLIGLTVLNTAEADLAKAAIDAVGQWKYQPTLLNGVPVEVVTTVTVNFRLEQ